MKQKNIALIGCGRIGFLLENDPLRYKPCTHYGGAVSSGIKINCASDINKQRLKSFIKKTSIQEENTFKDYKYLLKKLNPELVIISTWTASHDEICINAARQGAKVIILEKPIASNLSKAKNIVNECNKNNVHLIINHERRYDNKYRKVKKLLTVGKIGVVKTVHVSVLTGGYSWNPNENEGGGPLLHDGTHIIDMIRFLFGEITSVEGEFQRNTRKKGFEDRAVAWIKTANNIDIFLEAGGNRKYFVFELAISGTEGKIIIGNGYEKFYLNSKSKFYTGYKDLKKLSFPTIHKNNCFQSLYVEAKNLLNGKEIPVTSSGRDGYKALEAIHAIYLSSYKNKKKINLPINPKSININKIFNLT